MNVIDELIDRANNGDIEAQRMLEKALGEPEGTYTKMVEVARESKRLAEQGDVASMVMLGEAYHLGFGIEKNLFLAESWFKKAADKDSPIALYRLAQIYSNEYDEYEKANEFINKAVKLGSIPNVSQDEINLELETNALLARSKKSNGN